MAPFRLKDGIIVAQFIKLRQLFWLLWRSL